MPAIGEVIRGARLDKDVTQDELAQRLGVAASQISAFEQGEQMPSPEQIDEIEGALGLASGRILEDAGMVEGP